MTSGTFLKSLDMFKVQHNFYLYKNQKSKGKKNFGTSYGSYFGAIITIIVYSIAFIYLTEQLAIMISGRRDIINKQEFPNNFNDDQYSDYNYLQNDD